MFGWAARYHRASPSSTQGISLPLTLGGILCSVHHQVYTVYWHCLVCRIQGTMCTLWSLHHALYNAQCTACNVQCLLSSEQHSGYNVCSVKLLHLLQDESQSAPNTLVPAPTRAQHLQGGGKEHLQGSVLGTQLSVISDNCEYIITVQLSRL